MLTECTNFSFETFFVAKIAIPNDVTYFEKVGVNSDSNPLSFKSVTVLTKGFFERNFFLGYSLSFSFIGFSLASAEQAELSLGPHSHKPTFDKQKVLPLF